MQTITVEFDRHYPEHARPRSGALRIAASGDLTDDSHVLDFNSICIDATKRPIERLVIDVSNVVKSDTKLVAVLISLYSNCRRRKIELEMRLSRDITTWLSIYDLSWMAELCVPSDKP